MSLCLRTFPNKFIHFVNTQKEITKINRRLPKHVKSAVFLEEFLNKQSGENVTNFADRPLNRVTKNLPVTSIDIYTEELEGNKYNWNKRQATWFQQQRQKSVHTLRAIDCNVKIKPVSNQELQLHTNSNSFYDNRKSCLCHIEMLSMNRILDNVYVQSTCETPKILNTEVSPNVKDVVEKQPADRKSPETQLQYIFDCLRNELPLLFSKPTNYTLYTNDVIFINNIRGTSTVGLKQYISQIALVKIVGHLKFAYVKMNVLKITMHPEDNSVKVRWRIVGISGTKIIFSLWKIKVWNVREYISKQGSWHDGLSTFYVNNEGKIFKHVVDKVMPSENTLEEVKPPIAKVALFIALLGLDSVNFSKLRLGLNFQLPRIK